MDRAQQYYRGERVSNAILVFSGFAGLIWTLGVYLWRQGHLSTGMFYSAFPLAVFLVISGIYRFVRSIGRYKRILSGGDSYIIEEARPMFQERLNRFRIKRKVDLLFVVVSLLVMTIGLIQHWHHVTVGSAISILICSSILLIYDLFGQFRTEEFLHHIDKKKK